MSDYQRVPYNGHGRPPRRRDNQPEQPPQPPLKVRPPMYARLAVPGASVAVIAGERISVVARAEDLPPGTVADWVSCAVCGSEWHPQRGHEGGVLLVRRWNAVTGRVHRVAAACRCQAGARLDMTRVTDGEWKRAVASARRAVRKGVNALTEEVIMTYLIAPRGPSFQGRWGYYAEYLTRHKVNPHAAFRRAYVKVWQQVMR